MSYVIKENDSGDANRNASWQIPGMLFIISYYTGKNLLPFSRFCFRGADNPASRDLQFQ